MILLTFLCLQWLHGRVWLVGGRLRDWYYQCWGQPEKERIWKTLPPDCTLLRGRGETSFSGMIPLNVADEITDYTAGSILALHSEMVAKPSLHQGMWVTWFRKKLRDMCEDELHHNGLNPDLLKDCGTVKPRYLDILWPEHNHCWWEKNEDKLITK